uniref:Uncharacterized protein n=1 Tax=Kalanchoe fedtschenkoi TaxID=63787 RepID=A0A7N1A9R8_KALFE
MVYSVVVRRVINAILPAAAGHNNDMQNEPHPGAEDNQAEIQIPEMVIIPAAAGHNNDVQQLDPHPDAADDHAEIQIPDDLPEVSVNIDQGHPAEIQMSGGLPPPPPPQLPGPQPPAPEPSASRSTTDITPIDSPSPAVIPTASTSAAGT